MREAAGSGKEQMLDRITDIQTLLSYNNNLFCRFVHTNTPSQLCKSHRFIKYFGSVSSDNVITCNGLREIKQVPKYPETIAIASKFFDKWIVAGAAY